MTENPVREAINKLDGALIDLDSARFALAYLVEEADTDAPHHVVQCVINTLSQAAQDAKAGCAVIFEELKDKMDGR